ncbi:unnamed protein product [Musa acuminata var. zebrina]
MGVRSWPWFWWRMGSGGREWRRPDGGFDLVGGLVEDLFAEELRQRMAGPTMEEQLPGLMSGLEGQWGSRRRRMTVDDSELGDRLPKGWKLLLGLEGKVKYCRCYIRSFTSNGLKKICHGSNQS